MRPRLPLSRRKFLTTAGGASIASGIWAGFGFKLPNKPIGLNEKLNLGIIGTANRAAANIAGLREENLVAICDVDENFLGSLGQKLPAAKQYIDFRDLIEKENLDGIVISTADHTHAPAALQAIDAGLHVYCEKPLSHTVEESRLIAKAAKGKKIVTQLGTQIHSHDNYRRVVEMVQSGVIGVVNGAHAWVGKAWGGHQELGPSLRDALRSNGPVLIEVPIPNLVPPFQISPPGMVRRP